MLQVAYIRENKEEVIKGLAKRNMDASELVNLVIELDEKRRSTQVELDNILAESNKLSKEIGELMRNGEKEKAEATKAKTADLKEKTKELTDVLNEATASLQEELYKLPNIPTAIVPEGKTADDNLNVYQDGEIPTLHEGAMPHWELAKKYDIIDFDLGAKITGAGFRLQRKRSSFTACLNQLFFR